MISPQIIFWAEGEFMSNGTSAIKFSTVVPQSTRCVLPGTDRRKRYAAVYIFVLGVPLLLLSDRVSSFFGSAETDQPWVRLLGMVLLGLTFTATGIFRSRTAAPIVRSGVVCMWYIVASPAVALVGYARGLYLIALNGFIVALETSLSRRRQIRPFTSMLIAVLVGALMLSASDTEALAEQQSNSHLAPEIAMHYVEAGGLRLRYATVGQGDPLLLLHTMRTQHEYFRAILPDLARSHQVIALDLPGHGESAIPDVEYTENFFTQSVAAFLRQLDLRNVTLVGESIGVAIALSLAADNPEGRVRRVVAVNPYDYADPDAGGITRSSTFAKVVFTAVEWPAMGWLMSLSERPFVLRRIMGGGFYDETHLSDDLVTLFANTGAREGFHCAERSLFHHWQSWVGVRRKYEAIRVPVLLVYGDHDWSLKDERLDNQRRIAGSQLVTLERTGHFASLESPDQVLRATLGGTAIHTDVPGAGTR